MMVHSGEEGTCVWVGFGGSGMTSAWMGVVMSLFVSINLFVSCTGG